MTGATSAEMQEYRRCLQENGNKGLLTDGQDQKREKREVTATR